MPDPPALYRCRYLERYFNRRQKERDEAAMKQKKKEEKEKRKQEKEKKDMAKKQKKVPPGLSVYLFACSYLQTPSPRPKALKTKGSD
jgi:hypothetical protein